MIIINNKQLEKLVTITITLVIIVVFNENNFNDSILKYYHIYPTWLEITLFVLIYFT